MSFISLQNVSMAFGGPLLLDAASLHIDSGERICLVGRNGEGKSTLLKILLGELRPDYGSVRSGTRLEVVYFDQHRILLDDDKSVVENVAEGTGHVTVNGSTRHVIGYLVDFLFLQRKKAAPPH